MGATAEQTEKSVPHPFFDNATLFREGSEEILRVRLSVHTDEYSEWIKEMERAAADPKMKETVLLPLRHSIKYPNPCSQCGTAVLEFETFMLSMRPEVMNRAQIRRPFQEVELMYLLFVLVKASFAADSLEMSLGRITPETMLVNNNSTVKVVAPCSLPLSAFNHSFNEESLPLCRYFAAPEELHSNYLKGKEALNRSQVFRIGLTLLEIASFQDCAGLHEKQSSSTGVKEKLNSMYNICSQRYSESTVRLLRSMTEVNPVKRIRIKDMFSLLQPYEEELINLEQVKIPLLPHSSRNLRSPFERKKTESNDYSDGRSTPRNMNEIKESIASNQQHPSLYSQMSNQSFLIVNQEAVLPMSENYRNHNLASRTQLKSMQSYKMLAEPQSGRSPKQQMEKKKKTEQLGRGGYTMFQSEMGPETGIPTPSVSEVIKSLPLSMSKSLKTPLKEDGWSSPQWLQNIQLDTQSRMGLPNTPQTHNLLPKVVHNAINPTSNSKKIVHSSVFPAQPQLQNSSLHSNSMQLSLSPVMQSNIGGQWMQTTQSAQIPFLPLHSFAPALN